MKYLENGIEVNGEFYKLNQIIEKCNELKIKKQNSALLKIEWDFRGGEVYEHRVYPKKIAEKIKKLLLDKEVYFGEIAGKHSEVYGDLTENDFKIITSKKEVKEFLADYPNGVDYNHSFIENLLESYNDNEGRDYHLEDYGKDYCDEVEELEKIYK